MNTLKKRFLALLFFALICLRVVAANGTWAIGSAASGTWTTTDEGDGTYSLNLRGGATPGGAVRVIVTQSPETQYGPYAGNPYSNPIGYWFAASDDVPASNKSYTLDELEGNTTVYVRLIESYFASEPAVYGEVAISLTPPGGDFRTSVFLVNKALSTGIGLDFVQDGALVASTYVAANTTSMFPFQSTSGGEVTIRKVVGNVVKMGNSFIGGDGSTVDIGKFTPPEHQSGTPVNDSKTFQIDGPGDPTPDAKKSIWVQGNATLDGDIFREGVDKIVAKIGDTATTGGNASIDLSTTNQKLDELGGKVDGVKDAINATGNTTHSDLGGIAAAITGVRSALRPTDNPYESSQETTNILQAAAGNVTQMGALAVMPTQSGVGLPEGETVEESYTQTLGGQVLHMGLAEAYLPHGANTLLKLARPLMLLVALIMLAKAGAETVKDYLIGLGSADSGGANAGIENVVPGVVQAKQMAQASIVTVAIFVAVAAMIGVIDTLLSGALSGTTFGNVFKSISLEAVGPSAFWLINRYIPVVALGLIFLERAALPIAVAPVYGAALTTIKFVKP